MKFVRFLTKAYVNDTYYNAGDEALVADDVRGPHVVDIREEQEALERGEVAEPIVPQEHRGPYFIDHSADVVTDQGILQRDGTSPHVIADKTMFPAEAIPNFDDKPPHEEVHHEEHPEPEHAETEFHSEEHPEGEHVDPEHHPE